MEPSTGLAGEEREETIFLMEALTENYFKKMIFESWIFGKIKNFFTQLVQDGSEIKLINDNKNKKLN